MRSERDNGGRIGHTLRKPTSTITRQGTHKERGRPRNMWRRDLMTDIKRTGYSWRELEKKAQDKRLWPSWDIGHWQQYSKEVTNILHITVCRAFQWWSNWSIVWETWRLSVKSGSHLMLVGFASLGKCTLGYTSHMWPVLRLNNLTQLSVWLFMVILIHLAKIIMPT